MAKKDPAKPGWLTQLRQTYTLTKQRDPKIGLVLLGTFLVAALITFGVFWLIFRSYVFPSIMGVMTGLLAALVVFGRRAQRSALSQIEGKPGASIAVLGMLRRGWKVEQQPIAFTKQQDVVFRVVGPPGIVLVAEGNTNRLKPLLAAERKRHERVASETPIKEVYVGDGEGQVPLGKLVRHVTRMGRDLKPAQMTDVLQRLRALDATRSAMPVPKGPMPNSMKGARGNLRGR